MSNLPFHTFPAETFRLGCVHNFQDICISSLVGPARARLELTAQLDFSPEFSFRPIINLQVARDELNYMKYHRNIG